MAAQCYIVSHKETKKCILIDPGDDAEYIIDTIMKHRLTPILSIATHGHVDHIMAAYAIQHTFDIPFMLHGNDVFLLSRMAESAKRYFGYAKTDPPVHVDRTVDEGYGIQLENDWITVFHTPGHTPGSICLYAEEQAMLYCGDTIFDSGAVGRTDWSYSDPAALQTSIRRILSLDPDTILYCGHGLQTTVRKERQFHPNLIY